MSDYISVADLKLGARLNKIDNSADDELAVFITTASRWVDRYCQLPDNGFIAESGVLYLGPRAMSGKLLRFDDPIVSVTSLLNGDGSNLSASTYRLLPRNEGPPYWRLELKSTSAWIFSTDGEIVLTGLRGYSAVIPALVAEATGIVAGWLFNQWATTLRGTGGSAALGERAVEDTLPATATALLSPIITNLEKYRI